MSTKPIATEVPAPNTIAGLRSISFTRFLPALFIASIVIASVGVMICRPCGEMDIFKKTKTKKTNELVASKFTERSRLFLRSLII